MASSATRLVRADGSAVHKEVPASHWCVTREDLIKLRGAVRHAVQQGHVRPTELDIFDVADDTHGPCVHTVVAQLIIPVSYMAGGLSWALVQHPSGLPCDLFVTHGWAEGIYEFIDKVLYSWPPDTTHAYCCMLSNPQALSIGALIESPSDSPFAKALASATHVLVVPNRKASIYGRAWCAYEAYLAWKWDKTLEVASEPLHAFWRHVLIITVYGLVCTIIHVLVFHNVFHRADVAMQVSGNWDNDDWDDFHENILSLELFYTQLLRILELVTVMMPASHKILGRTADCLGLAVALGGAVILSLDPVHTLTGEDATVITLLQYGIMPAAVFISSHFDRLWNMQLMIGQTQLLNGYSGHVCDSQASVEEDKRKILSEIRSTDGEAAADETIAVLLKSGMSTKSLRVAHQAGVDISGVGRVKIKFLAVCAQGWLLGIIGIDLPENDSNSPAKARVARYVLIASALFWIVRFWCRFNQKDARAFMAASVWKLFGLPYIAYTICYLLMADIYIRFRAISVVRLLNMTEFAWYRFLSPGLFCFATLVAMSDLGSVASLPFCGIWLAQLTAKSDVQWNSMLACCRCRQCDASAARLDFVKEDQHMTAKVPRRSSVEQQKGIRSTRLIELSVLAPS